MDSRVEVDNHVICDAEVIYNFFRLNQPLVESDVLLVLGNEDNRTASHAAKVFLEGWAPLVVITGKQGTGTKGHLSRTEAEVFADIMTSLGVPDEKIILENQATNTGENFRFSKTLLSDTIGLVPTSVIVATKSVMELRVALTFKKQWKNSENVKLTVTSPPLSLREFPSEHVGPMETVVTYLVNTFEKLTSYTNLGYQAAVSIPLSVQKAYDNLVYREQ